MKNKKLTLYTSHLTNIQFNDCLQYLIWILEYKQITIVNLKNNSCYTLTTNKTISVIYYVKI